MKICILITLMKRLICTYFVRKRNSSS
ncbi:unnamed protein product [Linum tenue]|uniref:Uncharacterized protein n=1 Tax=Linum tenue TaxID=586396 RepID=A0AAV0PSR7_9ROSI|nr:unnamed protein product [Linum tenue]